LGVKKWKLKKWELLYRSGEDTKLKLLRVCVSLGSIIYWCVLSKPVMFTSIVCVIHIMLNLWTHLASHFGT
jgi:hypothetical protein